jgi:hypothetical protein
MFDEEFDHIVSLGSYCQTAYQIRRRFGIDTAHVFDWWVTPTVSLIDLFESNFSHLFVAENMKIVHEDAGDAVMCAHYGLMHYHDFDEAKIDGRPAPFLVRAALPGNHSKFAYLLRRFYALKGKVLFIRCGDGYVEHYRHNCDFDSGRIKRLIRSIENIMPGVEFKMLLLNGHYTGGDDERCVIDVVDNYDVKEWYGSDQGWDELFRRLGIRLRKAEHSVAAIDRAV